jgi:hypothetical protein
MQCSSQAANVLQKAVIPIAKHNTVFCKRANPAMLITSTTTAGHLAMNDRKASINGSTFLPASMPAL